MIFFLRGNDNINVVILKLQFTTDSCDKTQRNVNYLNLFYYPINVEKK